MLRARRQRAGGGVFGIGMQEIALICVIALIVVGPKKLPEIARALGKGYGEFRRAFDEMKRNVETDLQTDDIRRRLLDLPPPPPPGGAPPAPPESLLGAHPPAPLPADPYPYPGVMDGGPPPPEPDAGHAAAPPPGPEDAPAAPAEPPKHG
jgi:sec-independent protein translocase protein TatB